MGTYFVTAYRPDNFDLDRRIQGIWVSGIGYKPIDIVIWEIKFDLHEYWVDSRIGRVKIIVARRPNSGREYLKTVPDGLEPNNILALPHC